MHGKPPESTHLRSVLNATGAASADRPAEEESGLPSLRDGEYVPHARPSTKPLYGLHFVTPDGDVRSFLYVHLDSGGRYAADRIEIAFMGMEPVRVTIEGRNLWRLYDYIYQHRMPWVMVAGRDFAEDGQTIVTRVTYKPVKDDAE